MVTRHRTTTHPTRRSGEVRRCIARPSVESRSREGESPAETRPLAPAPSARRAQRSLGLRFYLVRGPLSVVRCRSYRSSELSSPLFECFVVLGFGSSAHVSGQRTKD